MTNYRRNHVPGASYFFTVNLLDRRSSVLTAHIQSLRDAIRSTRMCHPFAIDAMVVLPDHVRAVWTLPDGEFDYATRWRLIKATFSRALPPAEGISASRARKRERGIWQRRYWEHTLRDEIDFSCHFDYIHFNPVRHGYVVDVRDWPYSSFHRMVRLGVYPKDWGHDVGKGAEFGE